jgi:hypothetical protein
VHVVSLIGIALAVQCIAEGMSKLNSEAFFENFSSLQQILADGAFFLYGYQLMMAADCGNELQQLACSLQLSLEIFLPVPAVKMA